MEASKKFWDGDKVMSVCAIFISLMTLFIFLYQTRMMKEQSRLMVMPRMSFIQSLSSTDSTFLFKLTATNNGLGPAILDSVRILYKGKRWPASFEDFLEEQIPELTDYLESSTSISDGGMHPQNTSKSYFSFLARKEKGDEFFKLLEDIQEKEAIDILIYYSSVYEERWLINLLSKSSRPILLD